MWGLVEVIGDEISILLKTYILVETFLMSSEVPKAGEKHYLEEPYRKLQHLLELHRHCDILYISYLDLLL